MVKRTNKKKGDINTLEDLMAYRQQLKTGYVSLGSGIIINAKAAVQGFPISLLKSKRKVSGTRTNMLSNTVSNAAANGTAILVKKILPRRLGFFGKWLIALTAKKVVRKVIQNLIGPERKTIADPQEGKAFVPLPIAPYK